MTGKPLLLYIDNGAEFKSEALRRGCEQHGISLDYRPIGKTHYGGIIERVIGTLMQKIHALTLESLKPLLFHEMEEKNSDFESYVHQYSLLLPLRKRKKHLPKGRWKPWLTKSLKASKACPEYIKSEPVNAMSLAWYLPLMLSCPIHECILRQCYSYQGCHLYWEKENDLISFSSAINIMDQRTWSALTTGHVALPHGTIHGGVWLRLLRTLLDELHIPIPSSNALYVNMVNIWESLGLAFRGGQTRWKPYELQSPQTQQLTLMAAATAIEQIENRTITPPGEQIYLFLPEFIAEPKSLWQQTFDSMNEVIELAKTNPVEAKRLRHFILFGKIDLNPLKKLTIY